MYNIITLYCTAERGRKTFRRNNNGRRKRGKNFLRKIPGIRTSYTSVVREVGTEIGTGLVRRGRRGGKRLDGPFSPRAAAADTTATTMTTSNIIVFAKYNNNTSCIYSVRRGGGFEYFKNFYQMDFDRSFEHTVISY